MRAELFYYLVTAAEGNALVTGLPGSGKTTLVRKALRYVPPSHSVVVIDSAGDFQGHCDYYYAYPVNPLDLPPMAVVEILEESLRATYGEYGYVWTPAMSELLLLTVERGAKSLKDVYDKVLEAAPSYMTDTALAVRRRLLHFLRQFERTEVPLEQGKSTCIDVTRLDRVARVAYVLTLLELQRRAQNVIYVIDEAHRFVSTYYPLLIDHLRTGRHQQRFFVLLSHSPREFARHMGYVKVWVRFAEFDVDARNERQWHPSVAYVTVYAASRRSAEALAKLGVPLRGAKAEFTLEVTP
ncbi:MAG: AAA family ATPase [Thermoproteus sp.]